MATWLRRGWRWLSRALDDGMPMPVDQREERDWTPLSDAEQSKRRLVRLRLRLLEKRGKGGYR